jgi:hypothetical protein
MLLSEVLPEYHFNERHARRVVAPPERVFDAIQEVTLKEMGAARVLALLRGIRADTSEPFVDEMRKVGFDVVADDAPRELVWAAIGRPWKLKGGGRPRGADFATFVEPGWAKMAFNFRLDGDTLSTETRVLLTDAKSRRKFRRYWFVIRPFSGLIRRVWLRAIARHAGA